MTNKRKPARAVIYARVSLDAEGDSLAVTRQIEACRERAEAEGWALVPEVLQEGSEPGTLVDNSISASSFTKQPRPGHIELMEGLTSGRFDGVVSYSTDRISRKLRDLLDLADLAKDNTVQVLTIAGGLADLSTAQGRMALEVAASFSAMESSIKSERHLAANLQRIQQQGRHYMRTVPMGYMRGTVNGVKTLVKDPAVKEQLDLAFQSVLAGASSHDVAEYWTSEGLLTKFGNPWANESAYRVIVNPVYAGILLHNGTEVDKPTDWEPYLTRQQHSDVKNALAARRTTGTTHKAARASFPLSGILLCSCGLHMTGKNDRGRRSYICSGKAKRLCSRETRAVQAEAAVKDFVIARLTFIKPEDVLSPEVVARQAEISSKLNALDLERVDIENDLTLDRTTRRKYSAEVIAERDGLLKELRELTGATLLGSIVSHVVSYREGDKTVIPLARSVASVREAYEALGRSQRAELMRALGEYQVKVHGTTRPSTVEVVPKDLMTGEPDPSVFNWENVGILSEFHEDPQEDTESPSEVSHT